jgi:D-serine deaminase-like pyridoxal phosphate-dependent protein
MIDIKKPIAIIDKKKVKNNIKRMANKANKSNIKFRPHFKTHQSKDIGAWFTEYGVTAITVSSLDMANYFAREGWSDITLAVPFNIKQINEINILAEKITLNLLVDSIETSRFIAQNITFNVNIWIEIDINYHRTGVDCQNKSNVYEIAKIIHKAQKLNLAGLLTHAGNSYYSQSLEQLEEIHNESVRKLREIKHYLAKRGLPKIKISIGDTPTCSVVEDFTDVDEIRPGNFIFYDLTQVQLGSCDETDIAFGVVCPVISKNPERCEVVIYGGAIHLSKDFILMDSKIKNYGKVVFLNENGWGESLSETYVKDLSQEHGVIKMDKKFIKKVNIGDILLILPVHSCLTANLYIDLYTLQGEKVTCFQY